ncbi:MAG: hypothetical protein JWQ87_2012 [Candidatus Sulfotelmatobacter sp.]|nr:hypothetical protein [Candidatus Sulfotelmatobacter sp.]
MNEPALSAADEVRQFILAPPFAWRWNRSTVTFTTVQGQQDYPKLLSSFGWLETASYTDGTNTHPLTNVLVLAPDTTQNPPQSISALIDDTAGSITFRFLPVPDAAYTVTIHYQNAAPKFNDLTNLWAPIPDYLRYLYEQGFRAKIYEYRSDERFPFTQQLFVRQVIAANAGLSDSQIDIFLSERLNMQRQAQVELGKAAAGVSGRSLAG